MQSHISCIYAVFFSRVEFQIACLNRGKVTLFAFMRLFFSEWVFKIVFKCLQKKMQSCFVYIVRFSNASLNCWWKVTLIAIVWFFSRVCFQMFPQITCLNWCIIALVALVRFFSTVHVEMFPQIPCHNWCIVTLVREHLLKKEYFLSGIAWITSSPPSPHFGQLVPLFWSSKIPILIITVAMTKNYQTTYKY